MPAFLQHHQTQTDQKKRPLNRLKNITEFLQLLEQDLR